MAEVGGWVVAALIAVVAVLIQCVRSARKSAAQPEGPPREAELEAAAVRATVVEVAQKDIDALLAGLEGTDASGFVADAANAARDER